MCEAQDEPRSTIAVSPPATLLWHCLSVCIAISVAFAIITDALHACLAFINVKHAYLVPQYGNCHTDGKLV